jgi:hypothetical protein
MQHTWLRNAYRSLVRKPEKRPPRRGKHTQEKIFKTHLKGIWWKVVDWIHLAQDKDKREDLVNTVTSILVP